MEHKKKFDRESYGDNYLPNIALKAVKSSNIRAVGYDIESGTLRIKFKHGSTIYDYRPVSKKIFDSMMESDSIGSYFHRHIKYSSVIRYREVTEAVKQLKKGSRNKGKKVIK